MKTVTHHHVFTLHEGKKVMYVGVTQVDIVKRLQDMTNQARNSKTKNFNTPVSAWLRSMWENFKQPGYSLAGTYLTREEAKNRQQELIDENSHTCLNTHGNTLPFKPVEQKKDNSAAIEKALRDVKARRAYVAPGDDE